MTEQKADPRLIADGEIIAADLMSARVVTVSADHLVSGAWELMVCSGVRHVPVVRDGRCIGIVDDRRIAVQTVAEPPGMSKRTVADLLDGPVPQVPAHAPVSVVAAALLASACDAVVVYDDGHRLIGVITAHDLLRALVRGAREPATAGDVP